MTTTTTTRSRRHRRGPAGAVAALAAALLLAVPACSGSDEAVTTSRTAEGASTAVADGSPSTGVVGGSDASAVLSDAELSGLLYMVEEEKLAHDVYVTLGEVWGLTTFTTITASETTHTDAVRQLLDRYGIADPTEGSEVGEFVDPTFTALYERLVAEGTASATAALSVGAGIEELDIVDLGERVAQTDRSDIEAVYANLLSGSQNHLRAFTSALAARGEIYEPTILDQSDYDAILASVSGRGGRSVR